MSLIYSLYLYITQRAIDLQTEYTRIDNSMSSNQISIFRVKNEQEGIMLAKKKLYESCDKKSALFLSGGLTPKHLYETFAKEKKLKIGAAAMVDERFGKAFHENSNEKMMKKTGLLSFFKKNNIPFYSILKNGLDREQLAEEYDETVRFLLFHFERSIAVFGIGIDGHTAGLPANVKFWQEGIVQDKTSFVTEYNDTKGHYRERITLTFNAMSQIDMLVVLAFGENKKEALKKMFKEGPLEEIPARFYLKSGISQKTLLITDQKV